MVRTGKTPAAAADDPIGILKDYHRQILRFLKTLNSIVHSDEGFSLSSSHQRLLLTAVGSLRGSWPCHNADEEQSLFPRLNGKVSPEVWREVDHVRAQHAETRRLYELVERICFRWISECGLDIQEETQLRLTTDSLQRLLQEHFRTEEVLIFPSAAEALSAIQMREIAEEFVARRTASPASLPD